MKKEHKVLIGIGLLLLAGWFYWFQVRPANIKSSCAKSGPVGFSRVGLSAEKIESDYQDCIRRKGLY